MYHTYFGLVKGPFSGDILHWSLYLSLLLRAANLDPGANLAVLIGMMVLLPLHTTEY